MFLVICLVAGAVGEDEWRRAVGWVLLDVGRPERSEWRLSVDADVLHSRSPAQLVPRGRLDVQ